jgi:beta-phosphoglucomutase
MAPPLAAVFDLDGTLVDNMAYHGESWVRLARRLGSDATREQFERTWAGRKADEILPILMGRRPSPAEVQALEEEKEADYRETYRPHLAPLPGLVAFLDRLTDRGIRLAVATAAPRGNRDFVLGGLDLRRRFEVVVGAEEVARGKPAPDLFLEAARRLRVDPARCLAFEDAVNGVRAAATAGMTVVGLLTAEPAEALRRAGATFQVPDYATLPEVLEAMVFGGPLP